MVAPSGEIPSSLTIYNQWLATDQWLARPTLDSIKAEKPTTLTFRRVSKTWTQISGLISVPFESHLIPSSCRKWRTCRTAENPGTLHTVSLSGNEFFFSKANGLGYSVLLWQSKTRSQKAATKNNPCGYWGGGISQWAEKKKRDIYLSCLSRSWCMDGKRMPFSVVPFIRRVSLMQTPR